MTTFTLLNIINQFSVQGQRYHAHFTPMKIQNRTFLYKLKWAQGLTISGRVNVQGCILAKIDVIISTIIQFFFTRSPLFLHTSIPVSNPA